MDTIVVNIITEEFDVYIGRGSQWGNPFVIGKDGDRDEVIDKYKDYIADHPSLLRDLVKLRGKRLGCYCKPLRCHGDVLVELIERFSCINCEVQGTCPYAYDLYNLDGDCLMEK